MNAFSYLFLRDGDPLSPGSGGGDDPKEIWPGGDRISYVYGPWASYKNWSFCYILQVSRTSAYADEVLLKEVLQMAVLMSFEQMRESNSLTVFDEKLGKAIFVSHQWVGNSHPDPNHAQWRVFQEAMQNILLGVTRVSLPISAELAFGRLHCPSAADFNADSLYVWYDYLCCPQKLSLHAASDRACAIRSIPTYVARCEYFIILCPIVEHVDKRRTLNLATWAERGWQLCLEAVRAVGYQKPFCKITLSRPTYKSGGPRCRTERLARELSARKVGYTIVIESATQQTLSLDILRLLDAPGLGEWSQESDKAIVASALVQMVWNKLLYLLEQGDLHGYRFLLNRQGPYLPAG